MTSVKSHGSLAVGTVTVRRKPALTYPSPAQSSAVLHLETRLFATTDPPLSPSPPTRPSPTPEVSQRSPDTHKPSRHHMTTPLLPLYHPFGTLALSLPDLDPTVFGLPAPVAVFDDPTRRSSHRHRRPAAKVRDAEDPANAPTHPPSVIAETLTPTPETEARDKSSPRRRRGGGPGGKRRRKDREDGDATYPAKRPRHARSSGLSVTRALSREEGSPTLSNGTSPAVDAGGEEKRPERRTTRSRGAMRRRSSTASEDTVTSGTPSMSGGKTGAERNEGEERTVDEGTTPRDETQQVASEETRAPEEQES